MKLLIVDNHDSFTWNLVQLAREAGAGDISVVKAEGVMAEGPGRFDRIIFSPGPGLPEEFPAMFDILRRHRDTRILGVCLGLQAIGLHFGATLVNMEDVKHGRQIRVRITEPDYIFSGLGDSFDAGLYHSWVLSEANFPAELAITAMSDDNRIMAIRHRELDIHGVQFHPESVMTPAGGRIMTNWLSHSQLNY
jgi:anthranilate synthase component II